MKERSACGDEGRLLLPCFSCVLQMGTHTGVWPDHSLLLSSPSCATQSESCQCSTRQIGTLSFSYRSLEASQNHGEKLHSPWLDKDWAPDELLAPSPNSVVAVLQWAQMVVVPVRVGLVTWLAQDEAFVTVREIWAGQSWCEAEKASGSLEKRQVLNFSSTFCLNKKL